jgi:hypothetical protein
VKRTTGFESVSLSRIAMESSFPVEFPSGTRSSAVIEQAAVRPVTRIRRMRCITVGKAGAVPGQLAENMGVNR